MKNLIRYYLRDIYLRIAGSFSNPTSGIYILNSHFVSPVEPCYEKYCEFLGFLRRNCDFIRIEDAVNIIKNKEISKDCLLSFTFDDGFEECHSIIAPALEEFKTNAAFFINANFINGDTEYKENFTNRILETPGKTPMNWKQIKDLQKRGHIIGSHTLDHVNMNSKNYELINLQLSENKRQIEYYTNHPCEFFAYPFGELKHINNDTLKLAEKYHKVIFSATNYKKYFSFNGRVLNRRHIESWWPQSYINYFLSAKRKY
jgi:Predicted xylanase/chitin deacetylase